MSTYPNNDSWPATLCRLVMNITYKPYKYEVLFYCVCVWCIHLFFCLVSDLLLIVTWISDFLNRSEHYTHIHSKVRQKLRHSKQWGFWRGLSGRRWVAKKYATSFFPASQMLMTWVIVLSGVALISWVLMMYTCHNAWLVKAISKCLRSKKKAGKKGRREAPFLLCIFLQKWI